MCFPGYQMTNDNKLARFNTQSSGRELLSLFSGANRVVVITPFVTRNGLRPVLDVISPGASITLFTRWRADEVAMGVSDPYVFDLLSEVGGNVRLHHLLHAKAYIRPGHAALVGSANLTSFALGWRRAGGVELLVEVSDEHPSVVALVEFLEVTSAEATADTRDQVLEQATAFDLDRSTPLGSEKSTPPTSVWLPAYAQPKSLWRVYKGEREETISELARPDLAALDLPAGLTEREFKAYVASALLQGLPGQMAEELRNRSTYQAVERLKVLVDQAGLQIDDPERAWHTLSAWLAYFLPKRFTRSVGGPTLYG